MMAQGVAYSYLFVGLHLHLFRLLTAHPIRDLAYLNFAFKDWTKRVGQQEPVSVLYKQERKIQKKTKTPRKKHKALLKDTLVACPRQVVMSRELCLVGELPRHLNRQHPTDTFMAYIFRHWKHRKLSFHVLVKNK